MSKTISYIKNHKDQCGPLWSSDIVCWDVQVWNSEGLESVASSDRFGDGYRKAFFLWYYNRHQNILQNTQQLQLSAGPLAYLSKFELRTS